ncbi:DUF418 domain-containing protein [Qipengyuania sp. GH29]|nr:DUF418 domain-containing protein [Qipengyuania sphaerica]
MGILVANIVSMGQPQTAYPYPGAFTSGHSPAEDWMWVSQLVLIDGKMRGLFTILFGAGLYLFMEKVWEKGATRLLQVRRLLWLGLFGLLHYYLLWQGDILFAYAVSGLIAVLFCLDLAPRQQLVLGLLGYVCGVLFYGLSTIFMQQMADGPVPDNAMQAETRAAFVEMAEADIADGQLETAIRQDGSYGELVAHVFKEHGRDPFYEILNFPFETLPLMLIGMALYRTGFFNGGFERRTMLRYGLFAILGGGALTLWIGLATKAAGLTYYGTYAALVGWNMIPQLMMTLGYLALLVAFAPRAGGWLGARVSAAGRAAFTNYLGTSLIMLLVFGNWGLDLFGQFGRTELYMTVIATWAVMLGWSKPWLDRYRYGPLEWLWRCLTYGRLFELRR